MTTSTARVVCAECAKPVSATAIVCPHCGARRAPAATSRKDTPVRHERASERAPERRDAATELAAARRRAAVLGRGLGLALALVGLALDGAVYEGMAQRAVYTVELLLFGQWFLAAGGLLLVFGVAGAARVRDVPRTLWALLAVVSGGLALLTFIPVGRFLARLAGFEDL